MKDSYKMAVILPVYNESQKIDETLREVIKYSMAHPDYFFLFVDDGSIDNTFEIIKSAAEDLTNVSIIRYPVNRGKGYAVKYGFENISAKYYCFTDSDLAYPLDLLEIIEEQLTYNHVVIGSRKLFARKRRPNLLRHILGEGYNRIMRVILGLSFEDTQAGLKGFTKEVVKTVFPKMTIYGFGFDPEILYICKRYNFTIKEIPVMETERHSYNTCKLRLTKDSFRMLRDLFKVRKNGILKRYD
ncbi:MAG TPA: glycosyltransferase [Nitrospirae bacterium]|nr:glycosyltransferase [Nitrospirota bacterium]